MNPIPISDRRQVFQKRQRGAESALYEVICPAVYVIRVFGLAPYGYPADNRPPRLRTSNLNCVYTVVWIIVYSYIVVTSLIRFDGLDRNKPVLGVTENGKLVLNYLVLLTDLVLGVIWRKRFVRIWNSIDDFDDTFDLAATITTKTITFKPIHRKTRLCLWFGLTFSFLAWLTVNQLGMRAFNEPYVLNVSYMITYVGSYVAVFKFCGLVTLLGQRFRYLNGLVRERLIRGMMVALMRRSDGENENDAFIKKIETSYNDLLSTSEQLNDIYSCSLFLFLFNLCCHVVSNMYFFTIWTIVDPTYLENPKVVFCEFGWLLIYLVQLLLLHAACHYATLEANRMALRLLEWRRTVYRQNNKHYSEFSSTLHMLNRKLNFTAAGCFKVDLPLLTSAIGHLTTYLVILLQLPDNSSS